LLLLFQGRMGVAVGILGLGLLLPLFLLLPFGESRCGKKGTSPAIRESSDVEAYVASEKAT
jgi:hypothetical protein